MIMRCFGLTKERRRCTYAAVATSDYCELHRKSQLTGGAQSKRERGSDGVFRKFFRGFNRGVVPDNAKFDVPTWLNRASTVIVIENLRHHPDFLVRWSAAFELRKRRDRAAVDPLWQVLKDEPIGLVRQQAAVALGKIGNEVVLGPLIEGLVHDPDAGVRQACAVALGNLGQKDAADDLASVLASDKATFVRWDCLLSLGRVGGRQLEPLLAELEKVEPTEVVRRAYREVLDDLRARR
jgi:HEAT repeat protein